MFPAIYWVGHPLEYYSSSKGHTNGDKKRRHRKRMHIAFCNSIEHSVISWCNSSIENRFNTIGYECSPSVTTHTHPKSILLNYVFQPKNMIISQFCDIKSEFFKSDTFIALSIATFRVLLESRVQSNSQSFFYLTFSPWQHHAKNAF